MEPRAGGKLATKERTLFSQWDSGYIQGPDGQFSASTVANGIPRHASKQTKDTTAPAAAVHRMRRILSEALMRATF